MASKTPLTDGPSDGSLASIETALGHSFSEPDLLLHAVTHTSFAAENHGATSYERLEFLGDAVLELSTTDVIFSLLAEESEGRMTKVRASVVDITTLAEVARTVGLADVVRLGVGEERSGGADRDSILSDTMEAVLGAIYVDGGFEAAHGVVTRSSSNGAGLIMPPCTLPPSSSTERRLGPEQGVPRSRLRSRRRTPLFVRSGRATAEQPG
jgi:hypothetical protein